MLDFVKICAVTKPHSRKDLSDSTIVIFPEFIVGPSNDLMVRGGAFYAVWDEGSGYWSKDPSVVCRIVDEALKERAMEYPEDSSLDVRYLRTFSSKKWSEFLNYVNSLPDNYHELDSKVVFADDVVTKTDYVSKRLPYPLRSGSTDAYEELMSVLYEPIERQKIEWAIGAVISGDSKTIQKFLVLYGSAGSGKSTVLNIIQMLFEGYYNVFEAKALTSYSNSFSLEMFRDNPLVSIQHDGDLSHIEDNTKLNSIVSHEEMVVNEKRKAQYTSYFRTFLFMGTNKPVKITDAKSGIVRRLIDVRPTGDTIPFARYQVLMSQIKFELGGIAKHCLKVYSDLGMDAYNSYRPVAMMSATNDFFNFVEDHYDIFSKNNGTNLTQAWAFYKRWSEDSAVKYPLSKRVFKEELKNYFSEFSERYHDRRDGSYIRNAYHGFLSDKFAYINDAPSGAMAPQAELELNQRVSLLDSVCSDCPAQLANSNGTPLFKWADVKTTLKDIDTSELHYVKLPENHIVIDFDILDDDGEKSLSANLKAAAKWPSTYAELSKSGKGVHLHYFYEGDPKQLAQQYSDRVEVKVFTGNSSLRRKLSLCNDIPIATLNSGLLLKKGGKKLINFDGLKNEKALRTLIEKNLRKEIHPATKPSVDFIFKILTEAYESGMHYDVTDLRPKVMAFANNSTNNSLYCVKLVTKMPFHSDDASEPEAWGDVGIIFYDVEVFPNLFVVVWKEETSDTAVKMINPSPSEIEKLMRYKLIGFNNRRYDNHILYARLQGYNNAELYDLSQRIINGSHNAMFREAYNLSYADIYDFSSKKQSLKKFEVELGIHHQELGLPWDQPVPENKWNTVAEYCVNDVLATEATFKARHNDFLARQILSELSGLTVNDTTRAHMTKIIFGSDRHPQDKFVYTDLSEMFPGYSFDSGKSIYRGEEVGEGGYVYSEPGYYTDVALLDIASMHPNSLIQLNLFGPYTKRFEELVQARLCIKHGDHKKASMLLDGALASYISGDDVSDEDLAYALKIAINSVYGFTKAGFDCEFKDPRNIDNIVAKRGALFMVDLKHEVQERGFTVAHIKTDSIKIPNATPDIIEFVKEYGAKYGYTFEHEDTYDKMCLVNKSVYISRGKDKQWHAVGTQFQIPYVYKTLFTKEPIEFEDLCETKTVSQGSIHLDMNEDLPQGEHNYIFVGRTGSFCPIRPGAGGGELVRAVKDRYYAVTGSKGYRWLESEMVRSLGKEDSIDRSYYDNLVDEAIKTIEQYVNYDILIKE